MQVGVLMGLEKPTSIVAMLRIFFLRITVKCVVYNKPKSYPQFNFTSARPKCPVHTSAAKITHLEPFGGKVKGFRGGRLNEK